MTKKICRHLRIGFNMLIEGMIAVHDMNAALFPEPVQHLETALSDGKIAVTCNLEDRLRL